MIWHEAIDGNGTSASARHFDRPTQTSCSDRFGAADEEKMDDEPGLAGSPRDDQTVRR
jgi:hypothetical protein